MRDVSEGEPPFASVVIGTRNRADRLEQCLASLVDPSARESFEIIVVDNAPRTDATRDAVRHRSRGT